MRSHNDGNERPRGNEAAHGPVAEADVTSRLSDLESMLWQALGRIGALEKKNKTMERESSALREDVDKVKDENRALKWTLRKLAGRVKKSWKYPCKIQPDEYWHSRGFDDDYISDLNDNFISRVKSAVSGLVHGVRNRVHIGSDESQMIQDDLALFSHWRTLCEGLYDNINPHGTGMDISFETIQLNESAMGKICSCLRGKNVREVAFTDIEFTNMRAAIQSLMTMLKFSPQVKSLVWSGIPIESVDDMALFAQMISERHSVLRKLDFCWNGEGNAQALLAGVDLSKYKRLYFKGNNLQTNGRADIPNLIASNAPLESLDLDSNNLNDDDAVQIAESLSQNSNLKELYLDRNNIHGRGKSALLRAIRDTSSMNALSDSNHTCQVVGLNFEVINTYGQWNRAFKIHDLMVERYRSGEGNVPYFNREMDGDGSVVLAPFIMESVQSRHTAIKEKYRYKVRGVSALGLLYELVRDWRMPELFSFK